MIRFLGKMPDFNARDPSAQLLALRDIVEDLSDPSWTWLSDAVTAYLDLVEAAFRPMYWGAADRLPYCPGALAPAGQALIEPCLDGVMPRVGRVDVLRILPGHLGDVLAYEQAVEVGVEAVADDGDGVLLCEACPRRQPMYQRDDPSRRLATQFKEERVTAAVPCDRQQGTPAPMICAHFRYSPRSVPKPYSPRSSRPAR